MPPGPGYIDRRSGVNRTRLRTTVCAFGDGAFDVDTERADVGIGPYGVRSAGVRRTGGYKIRPYGHALSLLVGRKASPW